MGIVVQMLVLLELLELLEAVVSSPGVWREGGMYSGILRSRPWMQWVEWRAHAAPGRLRLCEKTRMFRVIPRGREPGRATGWGGWGGHCRLSLSGALQVE